MENKVQITAYYVSSFSQMLTQEWTVTSMEEAKTFVETRTDEYEQPKYDLTSTVTQDGGIEYDVSRFVKYTFSHIDITDYTDGREIKENV